MTMKYIIQFRSKDLNFFYSVGGYTFNTEQDSLLLNIAYIYKNSRRWRRLNLGRLSLLL